MRTLSATSCRLLDAVSSVWMVLAGWCVLMSDRARAARYRWYRHVEGPDTIPCPPMDTLPCASGSIQFAPIPKLPPPPKLPNFHCVPFHPGAWSPNSKGQA